MIHQLKKRLYGKPTSGLPHLYAFAVEFTAKVLDYTADVERSSNNVYDALYLYEEYCAATERTEDFIPAFIAALVLAIKLNTRVSIAPNVIRKSLGSEFLVGFVFTPKDVLSQYASLQTQLMQCVDRGQLLSLPTRWRQAMTKLVAQGFAIRGEDFYRMAKTVYVESTHDVPDVECADLIRETSGLSVSQLPMSWIVPYRWKSPSPAYT